MASFPQFVPECDSTGQRYAAKRILNYPYSEFDESGSDTESECEPDTVIDAVYDVVYIATEGGAPEGGAPGGLSAWTYNNTDKTITFKHVDEYTNPYRNIPVRRYKCYLSFPNCKSVSACIRTSNKTYGNFQQETRSRAMKLTLPVTEPMEFDMSHGIVDDNGFAFLKWRMDFTERDRGGGTEEGNWLDGYFFREGWAKRRSAPDGPVAEISEKEREVFLEIDRKEEELAEGKKVAEE